MYSRVASRFFSDRSYDLPINGPALSVSGILRAANPKIATRTCIRFRGYEQVHNKRLNGKTVLKRDGSVRVIALI